MLTKNNVAIFALQRLGQTHSVIDIDSDNSTVAKIIRSNIDSVIASLVEMHPWGFTTKIKPLTLVKLEPSLEWAYSYSKPDDCQLIREISVQGMFSKTEQYEDEKNKFIEVEDDGLKIYTDIGSAWAKYSRVVDRDELFLNHFGKALGALLALTIAPAIITNHYSKMAEVFTQKAMNEVKRQIGVDISRTPLPEDSQSPFVRARL